MKAQVFGIGLWSILLLFGEPGSVTGQSSDAFLDPTAESLFRAAQANWMSIDESVVRYTAVIKQRIAAGIRTPLKDRLKSWWGEISRTCCRT